MMTDEERVWLESWCASHRRGNDSMRCTEIADQCLFDFRARFRGSVDGENFTFDDGWQR